MAKRVGDVGEITEKLDLVVIAADQEPCGIGLPLSLWCAHAD